VFLEAEVSLISDIDAVSKQISAAERKVDYLYMSQGCIPLNVPQFMCLLFFTFPFAYADSSRRHERGPRRVLCPFILFQDAAHYESSATPSSVVAAANSERAQWR
jgi:hypothetical protein